MRTTAEIIERIQFLEHAKQKGIDFFAFQRTILLGYLTFEVAKQFLDQTKLTPATANEWNADVIPLTEYHIQQEMREYMTFALEKALDHRGLSANRSIDKMKAWLWLLGDDELVRRIETGTLSYQNYGTPILRVISEKYKFDFPALDSPLIRMSQGLPCHPDCDEGCGA